MQYSEVKIKIPAQHVDTAAAVSNMVVPYGLYIEDYSDIEQMAPQIAHVDLIEEELLARDREHAVIHIYIAQQDSPSEAASFIGDRLRAEGIPFSVEYGTVRQEDWETAWKKYYFPTKVGSRLVVCPSWEQYTPSGDELVLVMDPGMAFGTGTHETTQLCLRLLEECVTPGARLLDVGTGSGILSVAALLLGAGSAHGVDIDEVAVRVARENAQANGVQDRASFFAGDLTEQASGKYDIITANIVADVILRLLPDAVHFLHDQGVFIASGIIDTREQEVRDALEQSGLHVVGCLRAGGWVALAARHR